MPLVRIDMSDDIGADLQASISDAINAGLVEAINMPERDRFQIFTRHAVSELVFDPAFPGNLRREKVVYLQILLSRGQSDDAKRAIGRCVNAHLVKCGIRSDDVFIAMYENGGADWAAGMPSA
jgi:hypothetical protein